MSVVVVPSIGFDVWSLVYAAFQWIGVQFSVRRQVIVVTVSVAIVKIIYVPGFIGSGNGAKWDVTAVSCEDWKVVASVGVSHSNDSSDRRC
jgi:hypothetical protein